MKFKLKFEDDVDWFVGVIFSFVSGWLFSVFYNPMSFLKTVVKLFKLLL